jgi:hypothetical protein
MLYDMRVTPTTVAAPRVVDAHGLLHKRTSKAARACDAADILDGSAVLQNPTIRLTAFAYSLSVGTVSRARRLTPEAREAVRRKERPLVLPRAPSTPPALPVPAVSPIPPVITPVIMGPRERLNEIVAEIGLSATLDLLAATEKVAA